MIESHYTPATPSLHTGDAGKRLVGVAEVLGVMVRKPADPSDLAFRPPSAHVRIVQVLNRSLGLVRHWWRGHRGWRGKRLGEVFMCLVRQHSGYYTCLGFRVRDIGTQGFRLEVKALGFKV